MKLYTTSLFTIAASLVACALPDEAPSDVASGGGPPRAASSVQTVLYVSPTGAGSTCSLAAPCSLTGARDKARALTPAMTGDVVVQLRGGTYRRTSALTLGPADSGRNGHAVVYEAYPGERPVIVGSVAVTGFTMHDAARGIHRAPVTTGLTSRQLYVDGKPAIRARSATDPGGFSVVATGFESTSAAYAAWRNPSSVEVVTNREWKHMRCPVSSIVANGTKSRIAVQPDCWAANNKPFNPGFPFNGAGLPSMDRVSWLENAYELLDEPGEWYLDAETNSLYYIPRVGEDLATVDVELPVTDVLVDASGTPGHLEPVNDSDAAASYTGSWGVSSNRGDGDLGNDVHYTTTNGDSVTISFTGTGLDVLSELNSDHGEIDVHLDGVPVGTVSTATTGRRVAQQVIYSTPVLPVGAHTVKLTKRSGSYVVLDGFVVVPEAVSPVHDITFRGITFAYTSWTGPSETGYIDNQAGVLWDASGWPTRIPAAVQVHRGTRIMFESNVFANLGSTALDLADGTQDSVVVGNRFQATAGGGVSLGEVDDYYLEDPSRMTIGNTISDNTITTPGQDYRDAVGVWVGHSRRTTLAHNEVTTTPYSGMSLGWGWGWASPGGSSRHGSIYSGGNVVEGNRVHDYMRELHDGGAIYTLGGQGNGDGSVTSTYAKNVFSKSNNSYQNLYHDEGSSYWETYSNVIYDARNNWIGMWTPTVRNITIHDNYTETPWAWNSGTNTPITSTVALAAHSWPQGARDLAAEAGPRAPYRSSPELVASSDHRIAYTGWWQSSGRGYGDLDDDVHVTTTNGAEASFTFRGTGIQVIGERHTDHGLVEVYVDGVSQGTVDASAPSRQVQQVIYEITGLADTLHTIRIVKRSGTYASIDGLRVTGA
ncbi:MAG TPA: hypothetical protein VK427_12335 [Kofleriaceae bacterium]|nr:hypothetical protein [Kofleriaceae bacterium]